MKSMALPVARHADPSRVTKLLSNMPDYWTVLLRERAEAFGFQPSKRLVESSQNHRKLLVIKRTKMMKNLLRIDIGH